MALLRAARSERLKVVIFVRQGLVFFSICLEQTRLNVGRYDEFLRVY